MTMTSIMDVPPPAGSNGLWTEFCSLFQFLAVHDRFDVFLSDVDFNYLMNSTFWIFLLFSCGFLFFLQIFQVFFKTSKIKFYKRKHYARSMWNTAFFAASSVFLYFYDEYIIEPQLYRNTGRLFPTYENTIFFKSQCCEKFKFYSIFIITFYIHGAVLDFRENDFSESVSKGLFAIALVAINGYKFENYFVGLNLNLGIYNILTECLFLMALQNSNRKKLVYQIFFGMRIASWSHVFVSLMPFKYLVPTLFAKNFKILLNIVIWLWYGLSIWNSPVLQYFYHQIYHNTPSDCSGEGSAAKCILLKDSAEHRHFKTLRKAYLEVRLAHEKLTAKTHQNPAAGERASAKAFQAIKCIMTIKRKLKRIREGRSEYPDSSDDNSLTEFPKIPE